MKRKNRKLGKARKTDVVDEVTLYGGRHKADLVRIECPDTGNPVVVARVKDADTIDDWHSRGRIDDDLYAAGCNFRADFYRARLAGQLRAQWVGLKVSGGSGDTIEVFNDGCRAYRNVRCCLDHMGERMVDVAWHVIGEGHSLRQFALRCRTNGITMNPDRASGYLGSCLEVIAAEYGYKRSKRKS